VATAPTTGIRAIGPILAVLQQSGVSMDEVAALLELDVAILDEPDTRVPASRLHPLWDWAAERLRDPDLGLHVALGADRGTYDVFSFIACASSNLEDALVRIRRYFRLLTDAAGFDLVRDGEHVWWSFKGVDDDVPANRHDDEFALAVSVTYSRQWLGGAFKPTEVLFRHDTPESTTELEIFFDAPIRFATGQCAFRFNAAYLDAPIRSADPHLVALLERYAEESLSALGDPGRYAQQVRQLLVEGLSGGETNLEQVARRLAVSERSLQRHLSEEGTSHKKLLDGVRRELAVRYLSNHDLTASEVAYMLGFSETAPFFRAFKRWTGKTPGEFRDKSEE